MEFSEFFSRNHFLDRDFTFHWGVGVGFSWGGGGGWCPMGGIGFDGGFFETNRRIGGRPPCTPFIAYFIALIKGLMAYKIE